VLGEAHFEWSADGNGQFFCMSERAVKSIFLAMLLKFLHIRRSYLDAQIGNSSTPCWGWYHSKEKRSPA
jgi:hypothetical protein